MDSHNGHAELVTGFFKQQEVLFKSSQQGIYAYLDDDCRVCNEKFAKLLGYSSPQEWFEVDVKGAFPAAFVDEASQQTLVDAYQDALENSVGSTVEITWKRKNGETVDTTVILVPIMYEGHRFALHFVN